MPKVILISQAPLPYSKIGSWTTMYKNYLEVNHQIDYIVCEKPEHEFPNVNYSFVRTDVLTKIEKKITNNPYIGYFKALDEIIQKNEKYIIQIIDNFGIVKPLHNFLVSKEVRQQCYLQFFYHGFPPFYENFTGRWFFETIDEMVVLTSDSYQAHKNQYTILPTRFSVLHNGIDTRKFCKVNREVKALLKEKYEVEDKTVFVWCSQDRPKKGLHIILDAWKRVYEIRQDIVLWVIGCEPKDTIKGVKYLGKIPNDDLPEYFQASDVYLFPVLNHEGFGLSLIEALHCGNFCIASANGGVPEVLQYGKYGKLIENSNFVSEWENAILEFLNEEQLLDYSVPKELYSTTKWNEGMNKIIEKAKKSFSE